MLHTLITDIFINGTLHKFTTITLPRNTGHHKKIKRKAFCSMYPRLLLIEPTPVSFHVLAEELQDEGGGTPSAGTAVCEASYPGQGSYSPAAQFSSNSISIRSSFTLSLINCSSTALVMKSCLLYFSRSTLSFAAENRVAFLRIH
jgi:hypothetical protein